MGRRGYLDDEEDEEECVKETRSDKMDFVIVDPSKRDRCISTSAPGIVERAWIMTRPPGELTMDHRLVTARKLLAIREQINCWSSEYNEGNSVPVRAATLDPISNCQGKRVEFCMVHSVDNCPSQTPKRPSPCAWAP